MWSEDHWQGSSREYTYIAQGDNLHDIPDVEKLKYRIHVFQFLQEKLFVEGGGI